MSDQTEYMNGGVTVNLIKLFIKDGYVPTKAEAALIAAHDAMPRGRFYTEDQVRDKVKEQQECPRS
jgi:hypothetical protein